jgi:chorismate dehydratase
LGCSREAKILEKLRISIVEYLNTAPLVWGFTDGPLRGKYDLSFTVPSQCAEALRRGDVDVAIMPAVEYQRMEGVVVLPDMAVAAKGEVRSILLLAKKRIELVKRIALDHSSRSSAALVRLLCAEHWGIAPEFVEAAPDPAAMLAEADAALVIGDPALRVAIQAAALAERKPSGDVCCGGDPNAMPVPGVQTLFLYDVAHQWREMTGLPCVLALWVARRDAVTPQVVADFLASKEYGLARIAEIAEGASMKLNLPAAALESYLRDNIDFSLDEENRAGLELYFQKCAEHGLIPRARPVELAAMPQKTTAGGSD